MTPEEIEFNISGSAMLMILCGDYDNYEEAYEASQKEFIAMRKEILK